MAPSLEQEARSRELCYKMGALVHLSGLSAKPPDRRPGITVRSEHQKGPEGHWEADSQAEVGLSLWSFSGRMG